MSGRSDFQLPQLNARHIHSGDFSRAPRTRSELARRIRDLLDVEVAAAARCDGSSSPLDYLAHSFFEPPPNKTESLPPIRDCIVWANRAGGKTFYGAIATLLDLIYKPGIEIKVLAGSLDQAGHMHQHLRRFFERPALHDLLAGKSTERRIVLTNGSRLDLLAQSQTSVRGNRPQKLRCDEVDLFDPAVWDAAQYMPLSKSCGGIYVHASIEALSTWHRTYGLMRSLLETARTDLDQPPARKLFRWNIIDVLETCSADRNCATCRLLPECAERAKHGSGHISIDDAIAHKLRSGADTWQSEMLCLRPSRSDCVFPTFDPAIHVGEFDPSTSPRAKWVCGMDFGYRAPTVILWACLDEHEFLWIVDEHIARERILREHIDALRDSRWPKPMWIGVDPAGGSANNQTGESDIRVIKQAGFIVKARASRILDGLTLIRTRLSPANAPPRIKIHARCTGLIRAMQEYHYPPNRPSDENPVKDGSDHQIDALRYMLIHLDTPFIAESTNYLQGTKGFHVS